MTPRHLPTALAVALVGSLAMGAAAAAALTSVPPTTAPPAATVAPVATTSPTGPSAQKPPRLSVSGDQVLDPAGHPMVLRGYSWGQWGTTQPQDAAANQAQGAKSVRIPLRWWGDYNLTSAEVRGSGDIEGAKVQVNGLQPGATADFA